MYAELSKSGFSTHPNQVLSRERILNLSKQRDLDPFDRSVDLCILRLRRKIEPDPEHPQFIRTVRSEGYIFVPRGEGCPEWTQQVVEVTRPSTQGFRYEGVDQGSLLTQSTT